MISMYKISLKTAFLKLLLHFLEANELTESVPFTCWIIWADMKI